MHNEKPRVLGSGGLSPATHGAPFGCAGPTLPCITLMAGPHCAVRPAAWQLASSCCLLLVLASRATGARTLAQAPSPASGAADDPLSNIVPQDPAKLYQSWQNSTDSDSLVAYRGDMEMRLIGARRR